MACREDEESRRVRYRYGNCGRYKCGAQTVCRLPASRDARPPRRVAQVYAAPDDPWYAQHGYPTDEGARHRYVCSFTGAVRAPRPQKSEGSRVVHEVTN